MFQEDFKERYIKEKSSEVVISNTYLRCQFNKSEKLEKEMNKDLCNFTTYEIIEFYKIQNFSSLESLQVLNSQMSMYTQWCLQHNLVIDNQNHFLEMTIDLMKSCLNKVLVNFKIVSRETLLGWCSQLVNSKDQVTLLGLFEGIKGKDFCELWSLKPEDVQGNTLSLCTDRKIIVSDKLIDYIDEAILEDMYYSTTGRGEKIVPLVDRGYVIKDYPNVQEGKSNFQHGRKIYNSIQRILDSVGMLQFVTASNIADSGKIHMIRTRAQELNMTPKEYIWSDYSREVEKQYDFKLVKSIFWVKYEDYLQ